MQQANNFIVLNIREYLENDDGRLGEDRLLQFLSGFSCPLNRDVERFLKQQSVKFAKETSGGYIFSAVIGRCRTVGIFFYHNKAACGKSGAVQQHGKA